MRRYALLPLFFLAACGPSPESKSTSASTGAPGSGATSLVAAAPKFGFAGRLPASTEFYLGSVDLKAHREALGKSAYWKALLAFANDKKPGGEDPMAKLDELGLEDFFIALGPDTAKKIAWAVPLNEVYTEFTYYSLMSGVAGGEGKPGGFDPQKLLALLTTNPQMLDQVVTALENLDLPPIIVGAKTAKAQEWEKKLQNPPNLPPWWSAVKKTTVNGPNGATFTHYETPVSTWLNDPTREQVMAMVDQMLPDKLAVSKIRAALNSLAAKKVTLAHGIMDGYNVLAMGVQPQDLEFKTPAEASILSNPEFDFVAAHADKAALGLFYADAKLLSANSKRPFSPMLRGVVSSLNGSPMFKALGAELSPKLDAIALAEAVVTKYNYVDMGALVWWDQGLHAQSAGGLAPTGLMLDKELKFANVLNTPDAVVASIGNGPAHNAGRAFFEAMMDFVYTGAKGLAGAGLGGPQASQQVAVAEQLVVPSLVKIYNATKMMYQKGLGNESGLVIDMKGQIPPMLAGPGGEAPPIAPRIAFVHDVASRPVLGQAWDEIFNTIGEALKASPQPIPLIPPTSSEKGTLTTWFIPLPLGSNDILPSATLNDQIFLLGTSKDFNEAIGTAALAPGGTGMTGSYLRVSFENVRKFLKTLSTAKVGPGVKQDEIAEVIPWLAPFQNLEVRAWQEGNTVLNTLDWTIKDTLKYD